MEVPDGFERVDATTLVVKNVKQCDYCQGPVDRFCHDYPDKHVIRSTKYFQCRSCGAMGDPFMGMMSPPLSSFFPPEEGLTKKG